MKTFTQLKTYYLQSTLTVNYMQSGNIKATIKSDLFSLKTSHIAIKGELCVFCPATGHEN